MSEGFCACVPLSALCEDLQLSSSSDEAEWEGHTRGSQDCPPTRLPQLEGRSPGAGLSGASDSQAVLGARRLERQRMLGAAALSSNDASVSWM